MIPRLASGVLVSALIRRAQALGGSAAVLARGDADAGGVLVILAQRGEILGVFERRHDLDGRPCWHPNQDKSLIDNDKIATMIGRRRTDDPDLWAIELDVADGERFAAEMNAIA